LPIESVKIATTEITGWAGPYRSKSLAFLSNHHCRLHVGTIDVVAPKLRAGACGVADPYGDDS